MAVGCDCHLAAYSLDDEAGAHRTPAGTYEGNTRVVTQQQARTAVAATASRVRPEQLGRAVKAVADRVLAVLLLALALPLLLTAALLIELTDPGPVFHRQTRVGRDGVQFRMWKLRTMHAGSHRGHRVHGTKVPADPRVTRAGRLLRRSSIDELPQLLNVLTGSMSLVGPRPWLPGELPAAPHALSVRPGMTGLWQISGRAELDAATRVALDLAYVENWSLRLDAHILLHTIPAVLGARGAY